MNSSLGAYPASPAPTWTMNTVMKTLTTANTSRTTDATILPTSEPDESGTPIRPSRWLSPE